MQRSTDNGASWTAPTFDNAAPGDDLIFYGMDYGNGVWIAAASDNRILRSTDNGATWSECPKPSTVYSSTRYKAVKYVIGRWWLSIDSFSSVPSKTRVDYSDDDGDTWSTLDISPLLAVPNDGSIIGIGVDNGDLYLVTADEDQVTFVCI